MSNGKKIYILVVLLALAIFFSTNVSAADCFNASADPIPICSCLDLNQTRDYSSSTFSVQNNIDCSDTINWESGSGWASIGSTSPYFTGTFDGQGYEISGIHVNRSASNYAGLFGILSNANVMNVNVVDAHMVGYRYNGILAGSISGSTVVENCSSSGSINGSYYDLGGLVGYASATINGSSSSAIVQETGSGTGVGGLVGTASGATILSSYTTGTVIAYQRSGGIVGTASSSTLINGSYSSANVTGESGMGGIVGHVYGGNVNYSYFTGTVTNTGGYTAGIAGFSQSSTIFYKCYSTGNITGTSSVGGISGYNEYADIINCYSTGNITGTSGTGGIAGAAYQTDMTNCYSKATVNGGSYTGGLIGNQYYGTASNSYATGAVRGGGDTGGAIGNEYYTSTCTNLFWDNETTGQSSTECDGTGKTTAEMKDIATYTDTNTVGLTSAWDFQGTSNNDSGTDDFWGINSLVNDGYPVLVGLGDGQGVIAPIATLNTPSDNYYIADAETVTFNCSYSAYAGAQNVSLYITNSSNDAFAENQSESVNGSSGSSSWDVVLSAGNYTWGCLSYDILNASDWSSNRSVILDTSAPVFSTFANQSLAIGNALSYTVEANDTGSGVDCYTVNDTTNFQMSCAGLLQNNTVLAIGSYDLTITVNDSVGNSVSSEMFVNITAVPSVTIKLLSPVIDGNVTQNLTFSFSVNVTCHDANCGDINVSLDPKESGLELDDKIEYSTASALTLYDNKSFDYDIQDGCDLSDGEADVFDGGLRLYINSSEYTGTRSSTEDDGREAICAAQTKSSLNVSRKVYVPADQNWARYLEILHNPTESTECVNVRIYQNMGSDGSDFMNTSDYNLSWEVTDNWMMWDDSSATAGDDAAGFLYHHEDATEKIDLVDPSTAGGGDNEWTWSDVCVSAGDTKILMHFFTQWDTRAQSEAELDYICTNIGEDLYVTGMSDEEVSQVVNLPLSSVKSGLISTVEGETPFYTTSDNPTTINLNEGESQTVTWTVNTTGNFNTTHEFFAYANQTTDTDISNETAHVNLTIVSFVVGTQPPSISIEYPTATSYTIDITELNYSASTDQILDVCWYSTDGGVTNSSTVSANTNFAGLTSAVGSNTWTVYCNDNNTFVGSSSVVFSKVPEIKLEMVSPTGDINATQNDTFSVSAKVTCKNMDCGDINVSLDPTDRTPRTCSEVWGESCEGADPYTANYSFDGCAAGSYYSSGFWVDEVTVDATTVEVGDTINITCNYDCYSSSSLNDISISYYNGTWNQIWSQDSSCTDGDYSAQVVVSGEPGEQWARCQIGYDYYTPTGTCFTTTYSDNDDVNFTVIDSTKSGLISTNSSATPFYTTTDNPYTVNLDQDEFEVVIWTVNATGELDSVHEFFVYANWTADTDVSNITSTWNVTIINDTVEQSDTTDPTISIASPTDDSNSSDASLDVLYSATDETSLDSCWYSNDSWTSNTSITSCANVTDVTWSEGLHTVTIWANDSSGNIGSSSVVFAITAADTTDPVVSITSPSANNTNSSDSGLDVFYNVVEDNSDSCWYSNDSMTVNNTLASCTDILTVTWSDGEHTVVIWSNDTTGNIGSADITFTIDTSNPIVTILSPSNNSYSSDTSLAVSYSVSESTDSCWYSNDSMSDNTTLASCANITDVTWSEGEHNVTIWVNDSVGNSGSNVVTFNIDSAYPTWSNNLTTLTTTSTSGNNLYFNVTLGDINPEQYIFSWYNSTSWANDSATTYTNGEEIQITKTNPTSSGEINWTFYFNDSAGNENQTDVWSATIILPDIDEDGIANEEDTLLYNESNVTSSGVTDLNISIGGNTTADSYNESQEIVFYDDDEILVNFTHNFTEAVLDLSNVSIIKDDTSIIVNISNQLQGNKTMYITDNSFIALCVEDAEIDSIDDISSDCNDTGETNFTDCLGNYSVHDGINCTDLGSIIKIDNLQYSAIKGTQADTSTPSTPSSSSSSSGGTSYKTIVQSECKTTSDCNGTDSCYNGKCVKLFDVEIKSLASYVGDLSFNLTYLVKGMANISNDVVIKFWLQDSGKNIVLGKDTIYLGNFEKKTKTTSLNLPNNLEDGDYLLYVEVSYDGYAAESFRWLNVDLEDGLTLDDSFAPPTERSMSKIYGLMIVLILIFTIVGFYFRKKQPSVQVSSVRSAKHTKTADDLLVYIYESRRRGLRKYDVKHALLEYGWPRYVVDRYVDHVWER